MSDGCFLIGVLIQGTVGTVVTIFSILSLVVIFWCFKVSLLFGLVSLVISELMPLIILIELILNR